MHHFCEIGGDELTTPFLLQQHILQNKTYLLTQTNQLHKFSLFTLTQTILLYVNNQATVCIIA